MRAFTVKYVWWLKVCLLEEHSQLRLLKMYHSLLLYLRVQIPLAYVDLNELYKAAQSDMKIFPDMIWHFSVS